MKFATLLVGILLVGSSALALSDYSCTFTDGSGRVKIHIDSWESSIEGIDSERGKQLCTEVPTAGVDSDFTLLTCDSGPVLLNTKTKLGRLSVGSAEGSGSLGKASYATLAIRCN